MPARMSCTPPFYRNLPEMRPLPHKPVALFYFAQRHDHTYINKAVPEYKGLVSTFN